MATIKISDLRPTGSEFFSDSESYMNEISEGDLDTIQGGAATIIVIATAKVVQAVLVFSTFF